MSVTRLLKRMLRIVAIPFVVYTALVLLVYFRQRSMLYFPTHDTPSTRLALWSDGNRSMGWSREVANARNHSPGK